MKKPAIATLVISLCIFSFCLTAADFWQAKPPAEWTQKQLQKIITDSPWAQAFSVPMSGSAAGGRGGGGGKGRGGGDQSGQSGESLEVVARWQSAVPLKQALMRLRFGAEASTSPEAKEFLDHVETSYVIVVSGPLRGYLGGNPEELKASLMSATSLTVKGKVPLKPAEVEMTVSRTTGNIVFYFPRSTPYTLDDKEVELTTKLGTVPLVYKFRLKDMVFGGKLEL